MVKAIGFALLAAALLSPPSRANAQKADTPYAHAAPVDQYVMANKDAEILLARSAAPRAISRDAEVMVLDKQGYKTAVKGSNGFVCLVQRSWTAGIDAPEFWNPKILSPGCFNPQAVRSYLRIDLEKARLVMAGAQTADAVQSALEKQHLPAMEAGAMCYMLSKQGYLSDHDGHWHPHLMFFFPLKDASTWAADSHDASIFVGQDTYDKVSIVLVPVTKWSDGTPDHE